MKSAEKKYQPPGFTLVEVMVSMAIALIVMGGVYQTLADEDINHDRSEKILDMQNNARVALDRITRDVKRTGSLGCGGTLAASTLQHSVATETSFVNQYTIATAAIPPGLAWDGLSSILSTIEALSAGTDVNYLSEVMGFSDNAPAGHGLYQEGTDALTLVFLSEERVVAAAMGVPPTPATFTIDAPGFSQDDILYITDCENYSLTQATTVPAVGTLPPYTVTHAVGTGLNIPLDPDLKKNYGNLSTARVFKLNTATYFIPDDGEFELCLDTKSRQIASNIEDLQFEFLADENGNGNLNDDAWKTSFTAYTNGAKSVRAVRIWVLAMSDTDYSYTDTNNYVYPNSPYAASTPAALAPIASPPDGEHRHRYLASAVVYLRNAALL